MIKVIKEKGAADESADQNLICRLCGKIGSGYVPIFGNDNLCIAEKISRCLPIVVLSTDNLPSHICSRCLNCLNISYKLIVMSLKVDSSLKEQLNIANEKLHSNSLSQSLVSFKLSSNVINGPMKCQFCSKVFVDMKEFDSHVDKEHLLAWPCSLCDESFDTSNQLIEHKDVKHAGNLQICGCCISNKETKEEAAFSEIIESSEKNFDENDFEIYDDSNDSDLEIEFEAAEIKVNDTFHTRTCNICNMIVETDELLVPHERIHKKISCPCYVCEATLPSIYDLYIHKRLVHRLYKRSQLRFACDKCNKYFSTALQWNDHQRKACYEAKVTENRCKYCNSYFTTNFKLIRHLRKHRNEMLKDPTATIYRCVACPKIFVDEEFYQKHRNVHDPACWDKFKCDECKKSFRDKVRLLEHKQSIHEGVKLHQCDICGKTFHRLDNMRVHRKIHSGHKCEHCEEIFETLRPLINHIKKIHKTEPSFKIPPKRQPPRGSFICKYCGKKLATSSSLYDHEHIHTGEKPYSCKICDKTFRTYTARWSHEQRHVKGTYICEYCNKSFCYKQNLSVHMRTHLTVGRRKHRCPKCEKTFVRKSHLSVHMRIHDGVRPYTCDICNYSFTQIGDMRRHRARHDIVTKKDEKRVKKVEKPAKSKSVAKNVS